jgi:hypothetical protein
MTLRNAAFFAMIGTGLWTILTALNLFRDISGLAEGIIPIFTLLSSLIEFLAALSLLLFFAIWYRQS